ncbi:MAG: hypothetical protein V1834_02995 [Candidatus Micrarchaeota archaeon]
MVIKDLTRFFRKKEPRIVNVKQTHLFPPEEAGNQPIFFTNRAELVKETRLLLSDHEVKLLLFWAVISPTAGLAYLIWTKYERLKVLSIPLFAVSLVQFAGQWGGVFWVLQRMGLI